MKLIDVIANVDSFSADDTIYASEPWSIDSDAIVALEPDDGSLPATAKNTGMKYFIEVYIAKDFLDDIEKLGQLDLRSKVGRLIKYVIYDA